MPDKKGSTSKGRVVALLEGLLEQAVAGKVDYVCVVYGVTGTNNVKGSWQGTDRPQKVLDAMKGLEALKAKILEENTKPGK